MKNIIKLELSQYLPIHRHVPQTYFDPLRSNFLNFAVLFIMDVNLYFLKTFNIWSLEVAKVVCNERIK